MIGLVLLWLFPLLVGVGHWTDGTYGVRTIHVQSLAEMREWNFRQALSESGWPPQLHETVVRIARCESGFQSDAVSPDGKDFGDMQVRKEAHPELRYDLLDRKQNLAAAYAVYQKQGWEAWSCH